jgi:uncharacterized protein YebE (UPF0316 family)
MLVEERIALGLHLIRVFTKKNGAELVQLLNAANFGATTAIGQGVEGDVHIVETIINRKHSRKAEDLIAIYDATAFYVVSDVRSVQRGIFASMRGGILGRWRIGK